jgi:amino acid adenylation domain-containing protein
MFDTINSEQLKRDNYEKNNKDLTICDLFTESVKHSPNAIAIEFKDYNISYAELDKESDKVAYMLEENGLAEGYIIGLLTERSIEMVTGLLGILKAGDAYLPLDPEYPNDRIDYMVADSATNIILTKRSLSGKGIKAKLLFIDDAINNNLSEPYFRKVQPMDLAYIIYTSGSTGKPKGVMIEHRSVVNFINGVTRVIDFTAGKKIIGLSSISFDAFVIDVLVALARGLTVVLADEYVQRNPRLLGKILINNEIDMAFITPTRMQMLAYYDNELNCLKNVKDLIIGAEAFPENLLTKLKNCTSANIYNAYGPTETTVLATVSNLTERNVVDIGKPLLNTRIYIVDEDNNLLSEGLVGEICITGTSLARGYINNPKLTSEKFILNPFVSDERMYKTGDLGRYLPNGNIECHGRVDNQVKIRGYRIEIGEIESSLSKYELIKQAVVTVLNGKDNIKLLCALIIADEELLLANLREFLQKTLPNYMIPAYFFRIDSLPQTINGKIDRNLLPELCIRQNLIE